MSKSVNELTLIGHVGNDPEIRATQSGSRVAQLSLATNHRYKDNERTDWHRLKIFGRLVDVVEEFVKKGDRLYIRGRVEYSTVDSPHGTRYFTDVIVNDLVMLSDTRPNVDPPAPKAPKVEPAEDLPF